MVEMNDENRQPPGITGDIHPPKTAMIFPLKANPLAKELLQLRISIAKLRRFY